MDIIITNFENILVGCNEAHTKGKSYTLTTRETRDREELLEKSRFFIWKQVGFNDTDEENAGMYIMLFQNYDGRLNINM